MAFFQFRRLIAERLITPLYQPIVDVSTERTLAYEVLARSRLVGFSTPVAMFALARKLHAEVSLSRMMRWQGIRASGTFPTMPHLFLNTHPKELQTPGLADSMRELRKKHSEHRLTLEIHESAITDEGVMSQLHTRLKHLDISLAYDDFGSGRARLVEISKFRPEYLKFDISLIRGIDSATAGHQQMVARLVEIAHDLGIISLAEGVETAEEGETCCELGFQLAQGFHYGRPAPATSWSSGPESSQQSSSG